MKLNPTTNLPEDGFGIARFEDAEQRVFPAVVLPDGGVIDVSDQFADLHEILDQWDSAFPALESAASGTPTHMGDDLRPLPPLTHPNVMCAGANYRRHVVEMMARGGFGGREGETEAERRARAEEAMARRASTEPFVFAGLWSALSGANDDVVLPAPGFKHDWELELAAVISRHARHVPAEDALDLVAGFMIVNDLGTHDYAIRRDAGPMNMDFLTKFQPTYKPAGPFIVPKEFVDLDEVKIKLDVNGEKRHDESLTDMIFPVPRIVSYLSSRVSLQPGDMVLTGSPWGNAVMYDDAWLKDGDLIESEITGLGRQRNRCIDEQVDPEYRPKLTTLTPVEILRD